MKDEKILPRKEEDEAKEFEFSEEEEPDPGDQEIDEDEFADTLRQMRSFLKKYGNTSVTKFRKKRELTKEEEKTKSTDKYVSAKKHKSDDDIPKSRKRLSKNDNIRTFD